jgi:shikimate dehydrogenase
VAYALREAGAAEVSVWNRTAERAAALACELGVRHADRPERVDLLVNCTSVGLDPATTEREALEALELGARDVPATMVDLVYGAGATPLMRWAQAAGARVVDGLEVLVRQGARSLEAWTGRSVPAATMRRAVEDL